jgi:predicted anti-sigma-YlaC factor YlaD
MQRFARCFLIVVILALAIDQFAVLPAQAAQDALHTGIWDLARSVTPVATRGRSGSDSLPLLLGAVVLLAALSSSSGSRRRDRW